jgi:hypothetical protein
MLNWRYDAALRLDLRERHLQSCEAILGCQLLDTRYLDTDTNCRFGRILGYSNSLVTTNFDETTFKDLIRP